jgi:hypothetical protein
MAEIALEVDHVQLGQLDDLEAEQRKLLTEWRSHAMRCPPPPENCVGLSAPQAGRALAYQLSSDTLLAFAELGHVGGR